MLSLKVVLPECRMNGELGGVCDLEVDMRMVLLSSMRGDWPVPLQIQE